MSNNHGRCSVFQMPLSLRLLQGPRGPLDELQCPLRTDQIYPLGLHSTAFHWRFSKRPATPQPKLSESLSSSTTRPSGKPESQAAQVGYSRRVPPNPKRQRRQKPKTLRSKQRQSSQMHKVWHILPGREESGRALRRVPCSPVLRPGTKQQLGPSRVQR